MPNLQMDSEGVKTDTEPYITYDNSDPDYPKVVLYLPRSQVLQWIQPEWLASNQEPQALYDDSNIDKPTLQLKIPRSQVIKNVAVGYLNVGDKPTAVLDTTSEGYSIDNPLLRLGLPVGQQLLPENVSWKVLDADKEPYAELDASDVNYPKLTFYLPQSQVLQKPTCVVLDPNEEPSVEDKGSINKPQYEFSLPRAIKFYYGELLGEKGGTYEITNESFADYGVGDYYVNEATGRIYKVVEANKSQLTCKFEYQACIQSPLPVAKAGSIAPYVLSDEGYVPAVPQVTRSVNLDGTAWELEFKMPQAAVPQVTSTFVGPEEEGDATVDIVNEKEVLYSFTIPTGAQWFVYEGEPSEIEGSRVGDLCLDTKDGYVYKLTVKGWVKDANSLIGPRGYPLNIAASYLIRENECANTTVDIGSYIENHYGVVEAARDIFAIVYVTNDDAEIAYWFFKTEENPDEWSKVQLTGGVGSLIEAEYNNEEYGAVTNQAYSISYINSLIEGTENETGKLTTYSKAKIDALLEALDETLYTWGSFTDLK